MHYEELNQIIRNQPKTHLPGILRNVVRFCAIFKIFKGKDSMMEFVSRSWDMGGVGLAELREKKNRKGSI